MRSPWELRKPSSSAQPHSRQADGGHAAERQCQVTVCHSRSRNLPELVRRADIVVATVGRPQFIKADWIKDDAVVVDAGYHPGGVGDVELEPL